MEMIGKGPGDKGAVWVARRVPDGYVSGHANHPRIRQFPLNDPANCLYAPDVISLRARQGLVRRPGRGLLLRRHLRAAHRGQAAQLRGAGVEHVPPRRAVAGLTSDMVDGSTLKKRAAAVGQARPQAHGAGRDGADARPLRGHAVRHEPRRRRRAVRHALPLAADELRRGQRHLRARAGHLDPADRVLVRRAVARRPARPDRRRVLVRRGRQLPDGLRALLLRRSPACRAPGGPAWPTSARSRGSRRSGCSTSCRTGSTRATPTWSWTCRRCRASWRAASSREQPAVEAAAVKLYEQSPQLAVDYLTDYSRAPGRDGRGALAQAGRAPALEVPRRQRARHAGQRPAPEVPARPGTAPSCATRARGCGCPSRTRSRPAAPAGR